MKSSDYGQLHQLFDSNFLDYTSYVIKERAIPHINDGLKPVQRRIMQTLANVDDGRFNKVANVVGETMKLHPHGDASIFAALVNLANKGYLIERQGNFGNIFTGDNASAARYIECRLTPLAKEVMFRKELTQYVPSYDGRNQEPVTLPAKIPLLLLQGAEGIAVGMATKIMPHNFCELLEAQKNILNDEEFVIYPDFRTGGILDVTGYDRGNGKIKCRAEIFEKNEKTIVITSIPYTTTTQSLVDSIEKAARGGKIKIVSIDDFTAEEVEIEIKLPRGIYAKDTIRALYAFTDCEVAITPNFTVIIDDNPAVMSVDDVLKFNTKKLVDDLEKELLIKLERLKEKLQALLLEQIFIEERVYKEIEECKTYELVFSSVYQGLLPFVERLLRPVNDDDISRLLEIKIKRISRYDIANKAKEIKEVEGQVRDVKKDLKDMVLFTLSYIDALLVKFGGDYPRKTTLRTFREVDAKKVAIANRHCGYDPESGFLGYQIKGPPERTFSCSEYDKFILINKDGMYKVINGEDKVFVGQDLMYVGKVDSSVVFNIIYRDGIEKLSYVKRFAMPKFILEKEYSLFEENKKCYIQYLATGEKSRVRAYLVSSSRAKTNSVEIIFSEYLVKGSAAKGKRIATRAIRRIVLLVDKDVSVEEPPERSLPGMEDPPIKPE